ncbi:MAG: nucleotidyltransferase family protein [Ruminococcaceae bacterium]|nr:nucleotidyltransferase family protein [Oscillospiraceae bacterium]
MKHVGIICEFNPFHGGHQHLLRAVRGADTVVCLMSGNFTQRGEAALLPPTARAAMAVEAAADLVLELPFPFASASARYFATAGVRALGALGIDTLAFGSESADLAALQKLADAAPDGAYRDKMANGAQNMGDAAAYFAALGAEISSNDILGVEYLRAIKKEAPHLASFVLHREGAQYRETVLENGGYPSATALRLALAQGIDITPQLPRVVQEVFSAARAMYGVAKTAALGAPMLALLRAYGVKKELFEGIAECSGGLWQRLVKAAQVASDYESLCQAAATKRYTDGRIRRALLYMLSGVRQSDLDAHPVYLRLLAANARGREFLNETARRRIIPVVTKQADIAGLGGSAARQRELAQVSDGLYALCCEGNLSPHALQTAKPYLI